MGPRAFEQARGWASGHSSEVFGVFRQNSGCEARKKAMRREKSISVGSAISMFERIEIR